MALRVFGEEGWGTSSVTLRLSPQTAPSPREMQLRASHHLCVCSGQAEQQLFCSRAQEETQVTSEKTRRHECDLIQEAIVLTAVVGRRSCVLTFFMRIALALSLPRHLVASPSQTKAQLLGLREDGPVHPHGSPCLACTSDVLQLTCLAPQAAKLLSGQLAGPAHSFFQEEVSVFAGTSGRHASCNARKQRPLCGCASGSLQRLRQQVCISLEAPHVPAQVAVGRQVHLLVHAVDSACHLRHEQQLLLSRLQHSLSQNL